MDVVDLFKSNGIVPPSPEERKIRVAIAQISNARACFDGDKGPDLLREAADYEQLQIENLRGSLFSTFRKFPPAVQERIEQLQTVFEAGHINWVSQRLDLILKLCAWLKVHLLVLPEFSVPAQCLSDIRSRSNTHKLAVVAGSHYVRIKDCKEGVYEGLGLSVDIEKDAGKNLCLCLLPNGSVQRVSKAEPSKFEGDFLTKGEGEAQCEIQGHSFWVFICNDFLSRGQRHISAANEQNGFFIVVACTPFRQASEGGDAGANFDLAFLDIVSNHFVPILFSNDARLGGSNIYSAFNMHASPDPLCQQLCYRAIPPLEEAVMVFDLDPRKQAQQMPKRVGPAAPSSPTVPIATIPFFYDGPFFAIARKQGITYQGILEELLNMGLDDAAFKELAPHIRGILEEGIIGLPSTLREKLSSLFVGDKYLGMNSWQKATSLAAIPLETENVHEACFGKTFALWKLLRYIRSSSIAHGSLTPDEENELNRLLHRCVEWQRRIDRSLVRDKFRRSFSLDDVRHLWLNEAVSEILARQPLDWLRDQLWKRRRQRLVETVSEIHLEIFGDENVMIEDVPYEE